ncbi:MAG: 23S rRNA pseudouridine(1911/1915/1917) synthase RluD, partial [Pseudomonadales bacterium]|nr:23S rRNA pseudouridine(1911/1915/1917) synthase RluD [Pseudomonadales bacterium]
QGAELLINVELETRDEWEPENLPLNIVYEDEHLLVLDKPVNVVVHPAAGNRSGTLLNALIYHYPRQELLPRAGIVHRLDKDTSGLMVVAKTLKAHHSLVKQLQARSVSREYAAVVQGQVRSAGRVEGNIGRHPHHRTRMAVLQVGGKEAITHYRVDQQFQQHSLLSVSLETGRTHQIRVHMASIHHPLVGDQTYGGRARLPKAASVELAEILQTFPRQALHAARLALIHPETGQGMAWQSDLPEDMCDLLRALQEQAV